MKTRLYSILTIYLALLLVGCASSVQKKLDSYIGMDILEAQKHFGYNFKTTQLSDGNTAYTWTRDKTAGILQGNSFGGTGSISGMMVSHQCEFSLVADPDGKILSNRFRDSSVWNNTCWKLMD
jgi:hypothetical protein